jgi:hypothetical protein
MARQRIIVGAVLEISLENDFFSYCQIVGEDIVFFDIYLEEPLLNVSILNDARPLFIVGVYNYVITSGRWKRIGKLPIREEFKVIPMQFIQDAMLNSFELYNPNTGEITKSTKEACIGLERCAVWGAEHVESRIIDHYEGRPNIWVEQMAME